MADYNGIIKYKDDDGTVNALYPKTPAENVSYKSTNVKADLDNVHTNLKLLGQWAQNQPSWQANGLSFMLTAASSMSTGNPVFSTPTIEVSGSPVTYGSKPRVFGGTRFTFQRAGTSYAADSTGQKDLTGKTVKLAMLCTNLVTGETCNFYVNIVAGTTAGYTCSMYVESDRHVLIVAITQAQVDMDGVAENGDPAQIYNTDDQHYAIQLLGASITS